MTDNWYTIVDRLMEVDEWPDRIKQNDSFEVWSQKLVRYMQSLHYKARQFDELSKILGPAAEKLRELGMMDE